ncbi:glycosyltransferase family 2 protein [Fibrella sp. ES10-3-2-2]|nr:hypothetical protein A6C57_08735 [Fibrella sp. ES10-3-2-2]
MEQSKVRSDVRIAGVVVLYQSPPSCLDSIRTYWHQVEKLYIIDNSPVAIDWIADLGPDRPTISYSHFGTNLGIATALNVAAKAAIADQFDYLLTMDDDSQAPADMITRMKTYLAQTNTDRLGVLAPRHVLSTAPSNVPAPTEAHSVLTTMTSGNLLKLAVYQQVGPFLDSLFIDVVDHEYYLRLRKNNYQVIELPWVELTHRLGAQKQRLGLRFVSHNPTRNYYLVRNSIFVANLYRHIEPSYLVYALKIVLIETAKAALLEDKPTERLRAIFQGLADGFRGRLGKQRL